MECYENTSVFSTFVNEQCIISILSKCTSILYFKCNTVLAEPVIIWRPFRVINTQIEKLRIKSLVGLKMATEPERSYRCICCLLNYQILFFKTRSLWNKCHFFSSLVPKHTTYGRDMSIHEFWIWTRIVRNNILLISLISQVETNLWWYNPSVSDDRSPFVPVLI